jgi:hypothetical protein
MAKAKALAKRMFQRLLGLVGERDVPLRHIAGAVRRDDRMSHILWPDTERCEYTTRGSVLGRQNAEEQMQRTDLLLGERACLLLRYDDSAPRRVGEPLEHGATSLSRARCAVGRPHSSA